MFENNHHWLAAKIQVSRLCQPGRVNFHVKPEVARVVIEVRSK